MLLLKLGQREHMEMLRKGLLYRNSLAFFKLLEADPARSDPYEGTDSIIQPFDIAEFILDPHIVGSGKLLFNAHFEVPKCGTLLGCRSVG